ncbi:MAG: hypothetical protein LBD23_01675 [Oscillospiraceae bacterium]|nr:hypothetical protein [Oscillospiraceae bacterium]
MNIINTFYANEIDWKNNSYKNKQNDAKSIVDNTDLRSKLSGDVRNSVTLETDADTPENAIKDFITSFGFQKSLLQLKRKTFSLSQILNQLRGSNGLENSLFHAKRPFSGNTNVLQIKSFNLAAMRGADISDISVDVRQIAKTQKNESAEMNTNALATEAGFTEGSHHIKMNVNGRDVDIHFEVSAKDRVEDVKRKIAEAINTNRIDVRATISINEDTGKSSLVIESTATGVGVEGQPHFTFKSIVGNAVEISGIDNITQNAQNAHFRVNRGFYSVGELQTSRSNTVNVGPGITVQLVGTGRAGLSSGRDVGVQYDIINDMARLFNELMMFGHDSEHGKVFMPELAAISNESSSILSRIGINVDQSGFMRIDEKRLKDAAVNGELERFALHDGKDFINSLAKLLEQIDNNTMAFFKVENPMLDILY